ncbi:MAG: hypothetical protein KF680_08065 [Cryobacterium sp.]|nr:hypothetical protein [Cryobacterium sp.]
MRKVPGISALVLGLMLAVPGATPAFAAGEIAVSSDGTTWGSDLSAPLFDSVALVPRSSASAEFSVRNTGDEPGLLRIVLQDVTSTNPVFADALSIALAVDGVAGPAAAVSTATPCRVLFEGALGEGESVPVVTTLALADLSGTQAQGATAQFRLGIELSGTGLGQVPPTDCGSPDTMIELTPFDNRIATIVGLGVIPNTWQLYEEYLLVILLTALALGAGMHWVAAGWLRRRDERELAEQQYQEDLA